MSCSVVSSSYTRSGDTVTVKVKFEAYNSYAYYVQLRDDDGKHTSSGGYSSHTVTNEVTRTINSPGAGSATYKAYCYIQADMGTGRWDSNGEASKTVSWSARTYTVTYNKGTNGTGTNTTVDKTYNVTLTLKNAIFSRTGYTQTGWSTSDGGAKAYNLGASYTSNGDATLYPYWEANTYTVTYNKGTNGTGTNTTATKTYNVALTLKNAIFSRTGYTQTGWSTSDGGQKVYNLGASYTSNSGITLYPYWEANTYTISYNKGNYGIGTNTSETKTYGVIKKLKGVLYTRSGYKQVGWSVNSNGSTKDYDLEANYSKESSITLYPFWEVSTILRLSDGTTIKEYTKLYFSDGTNVYNIIGCYFSDGTSTHQGI